MLFAAAVLAADTALLFSVASEQFRVLPQLGMPSVTITIDWREPAGPADGQGVDGQYCESAEFMPTAALLPLQAGDLTWLFWTKRCETIAWKGAGHAEEEVQRGTDRDGTACD